jgi:hypothetical protein
VSSGGKQKLPFELRSKQDSRPVKVHYRIRLESTLFWPHDRMLFVPLIAPIGQMWRLTTLALPSPAFPSPTNKLAAVLQS